MPFEAYAQGIDTLTDEEQLDLMQLLVVAIKARAKASRNAEYEAKLEHSFSQLENGEIVTKSFAELKSMEN